MDWVSWVESRRSHVWANLAYRLTIREGGFRHLGETFWEYEGESFELPPDADRFYVFAYLAGYRRWCERKGIEPSEFSKLAGDE